VLAYFELTVGHFAPILKPQFAWSGVRRAVFDAWTALPEE
jgi:hypothetical protein